MNDLAYWLGLTSPNKLPYLFWSGFGACLRDIAAAAWVVTHVKKSRHPHWWNHGS